ncbi:histidine phosphatase family protein [Amorphus orientalis]|uniref:Phosphohistidine phosphatase SixA n=1 Tax=Amorphus orientalis TaxID=649198 RepID=A0AAE3VM76_9HYPH|nr:histidine phosphatase family protein [Amorphus orientalis]MDQ0314256.1 phosphohistidine phosphatase SixA [Amorphus orientalis]
MLRVLAAFVLVTGMAAWPGGVQANEEAAWEALRNGGVAIIRHARAPGTGDPSNFRLGDCTTQRNLSQTGRDQSRRLGDRFREEGVDVGAALHSRWCRARDTAELAFPDAAAPEPALDSFFQNRSRSDAQTRATREIVAGWDGPGALVLVTHQVNVTALTGVFPREGEVVVIEPANEGVAVVGRIRP